MRQESFAEWNRRQPFEPYRILCTDGRVFQITHPEFAMPTRTELVVGIPGPNGMPRRATFVSYFHILRIEPVDETPAGGADANGAAGGG